MVIRKKNRIKLRRAINTKLADVGFVFQSEGGSGRLLPRDASRAAIEALEGMINSGQISITFHRNGGDKKS